MNPIPFALLPVALLLLLLLPRHAPPWASAAATRAPSASSPSSSPPPPQPECIWLDYNRNPNLTSYEFQLQPHRGKVWEFEKAAGAIEALMRKLTTESRRAQTPTTNRRWPTTPANFTLVEGSRWDTVLREHAFAVSSRRGEPLHPSLFPPPRRPFVWKRLGYLRLRRYIINLPPGATGAPPSGTADLALKLKKVDARLGPRQGMRFAEGVRAKLEADVHCFRQRASLSALFAPVPGDLNVSRVGEVRQWFIDLAQVARLDDEETLPFCHAVWRRKATWSVVYRNLMGEVSLMAKYNTTVGDAVAGRRAKNGEISLRIRREVASISREGESEEERLAALYEAMDALAMATQRFRDEGWDGKTPSVGRRRVGQEEDDDDDNDDDPDVVCERGAGGRGDKPEIVVV